MTRHALLAVVEPLRSRVQRALRSSSFLERGSRASRDAIAGAATMQAFSADDVLVAQATDVESLSVLGRGRARIERKKRDGRVVPLGYRGAGELLDEASLAGALRHESSAIAIEAGELVKIPIRLVRDLLASDAALAAGVASLVVARQRELEDRVESLLSQNVAGRLVDFLLRAADRWGVPSPRGVLISAPITHQEIAQAIGSTRETVTLTLGTFRREGLLDVAGRRLIVKDKDALGARS